MEDTCRGANCWFYRLIKELGNKDESLEFKDCPFYQEMIFTPTPIGGKVETAKLIKDCSNKRSLLILLEEVYPRLMGVQKSNEEMRNSTENAKEKLLEIIGLVDVLNVIKEINTPKVKMVEIIEGKTLPNDDTSSVR